MDYVLTEADLKDLDDILYIEENAFISGTREDRGTYGGRLKAFPGGCILLKNANGTGRALGYLCAELWQSFEPPYTAKMFTLGHSALDTHAPQGTILYISSMGILDTCRGRGLGSFLFNGAVEHICKKYPHIVKIILLVNEHWKRARSIYKKADFTETGRLEAFFRNIDGTSQNGIIMEKTL